MFPAPAKLGLPTFRGLFASTWELLWGNIKGQWQRGWQAPLVPIALLLTLSWMVSGWVDGSHPGLSLGALLVSFGFLVAAVLFFNQQKIDTLWPLLLPGVFFAGFFWHRIPMDFPAPGLFSLSTPMDAEPKLYQLTVLDRSEERRPSTQPEWSQVPRMQFPCALEFVSEGGPALAASGKVLVTSPLAPFALVPGDHLQLLGRFRPLPPPLNPGESPSFSWLRRKGFAGILETKQTPVAIESGADFDLFNLGIFQRIMIRAKDWARQRLIHILGPSPGEASLAPALLLGDTQTVDYLEWDKFIKTGTIHALAISGQHLVIAGGLVGVLLLTVGFPPRHCLVYSTLFVVFYALITGASPSAVRAAIMAVGFAWVLWIRRRTSVLNIIALAWVLVSLVQPSDMTSPGCQLSFLAVYLLDAWQRKKEVALTNTDPETASEKLDLLEQRLAPRWQHQLRRFVSVVQEAFGVNAWIWLGISPLIAWHTNLISLSALVIGPLVMLTCTGGLICGMAGILIPIPYLDRLFGMGLSAFLELTGWIAHWGENLPFSWFHIPNLSLWGLFCWLFFLAWMTMPKVPRIQRLSLAFGAVGLVCLAASAYWRPITNDLLVHSIAVGHGTAILIEEPTGRVVLYDGGSMSGGPSASKKIAQVLWKRGISSIDEIIISHADTDHFNALTGILDRFRVSMVSVGPSFATRDDQETVLFYDSLLKRGVPLRTIYAGMNAVSGQTGYEILHPESDYTRPPKQNAASLVIRITYFNGSLLLTGDLEPPGTELFLANKDLAPVTVLMAPHHGSPAANPEKLWRRLNPKFVFSSEGDERRSRLPGGNLGKEIPLWKTQEKGMITIQMGEKRISAHAFYTGEVLQWGGGLPND